MFHFGIKLPSADLLMARLIPPLLQEIDDKKQLLFVGSEIEEELSSIKINCRLIKTPLNYKRRTFGVGDYWHRVLLLESIKTVHFIESAR